MDLLQSIDENLSSVDVRFLGTGDSIQALKLFHVNGRLFDQDSNMFGNEKVLDTFMKKIEDLNTQLEMPWNSDLSKPFTPKKAYEFKWISPLETPRDPIKCPLCAQDHKITTLKSKKVYKIHLLQRHKNEDKPDLSLIPDDVEVSCMLTKANGKKCQKKYDVDQIYR